jgi:hypothetical protein
MPPYKCKQYYALLSNSAIKKTPSIRPSDAFPQKVEREKAVSIPLGERLRVRVL